ncbi:MAG: TIGR02300 family protein [Alphaproteobacteria bacterium]|nr:TIGR02300 family protein [Alphaproteobacteria bacterium]
MSKAEWGLKRICPNCGMRYYDMKKNPPVCPSCKTPFDPESVARARRGRSADRKAAPKDVAEDVIDDLPVTEAAEDAVIEDAEELADEDVDEVVEVEAEEDQI